jgi:hypothetical protein
VSGDKNVTPVLIVVLGSRSEQPTVKRRQRFTEIAALFLGHLTFMQQISGHIRRCSDRNNLMLMQ